MEVVLGGGREVDGVKAEVREAGEPVEPVEEAEQEEPDALFVETSSKDTADLVKNAPFPTVYRTRMGRKLQSNLAKDLQTPLNNSSRGRTIIHGRGSLRLRRREKISKQLWRCGMARLEY